MTVEEQAALTGKTVMLFDGLCGLCNRTVRFVARRNAEMLFVPLESELGEELLARHGASARALESVCLLTDALTAGERFYQRSTAVAKGLMRLLGWWPLVGRVLMAVPRGLRDWGYGIVARVRYRVFGRYETCPLPDAALRTRFLGGWS